MDICFSRPFETGKHLLAIKKIPWFEKTLINISIKLQVFLKTQLLLIKVELSHVRRQTDRNELLGLI